MKPLVITAAPNICWLNPRNVAYPKTPEENALEAKLCREAGAAIYHTHAEALWKETIQSVRASSDIIIQLGMSSMTIEERMEVFEYHGDMISIILNHHDEAFAEADYNLLHTKEELLSYVSLCKEYGVLPEFEVWHTGSIWNLRYLLEKGVLDNYVTTLFFGWPGGTWSPATPEEYFYRKKYMPDCPVTVSIMGPEQRTVAAAAIMNGDNIRIGTEDYPYNLKGEIVTTHELIEEAAALSRALGREVATPDEARALLNMPKRG
jgi:3-keto-5-aminohexanoate cleavage enzyme